MARVHFVITNPHHHWAMILPVLERLSGDGRYSLRVDSLCELRGHPTPVRAIRYAGAECHRILPFNLTKESVPSRFVRSQQSVSRRAYAQAVVWHTLIGWQVSQFRDGRPDLFVLPNDNIFPYDRIVRVLKSERIPFMLMQEGIRFELPRDGHGPRYGQGGAVAIAAWGDSGFRYFASVGVSADRIHIVGNPRLDAIWMRDWTDPAHQLKKRLGLEKPILLFVSNPIDAQGFCTIEEKYRLFGLFLQFSEPFFRACDLQLVVKIHPSESIQAYSEIAISSGVSSHVRVVRDCELYPLFKLARGVVVLGSTTGLEALLFGLPLGALPIPGIGYLYDFVEKGVAVPLEMDNSVSRQLSRLLNDGHERHRARQSYIHDQVANLGHSAHAVGDVIGNLVSTPVGVH